ncbi:Methylated-DNA--protein-cysteine methyltransferase [Minicystis rosea]|nr:Methylated-DNA--protein-cysteine methyltransferase [Minicystis rosea]
MRRAHHPSDMDPRPSEEAFHALFSTSLGACAIGWRARGIRWTLLPGRSPEETRARLATFAGETMEHEPPPSVREAIERITHHLETGKEDLSTISLDMDDLPSFSRRVYELARAIAPGEVRTYGEIANLLGAPAATRAVGQALGKNPFAIVVPCHRVLAAGHKPGGFSAPGGLDTKARLLAIEGVSLTTSSQTAFQFR